MRKMMTAAAIAVLALAGCSSTAQQGSSVVVAPYEALTVPFGSMAEFVANRPLIVTGKVVAVKDLAYEVPVDPAAEGNAEGEGPEIYGAITVEVEKVVKGDAKPGQRLEIVYLSGKWNDAAKKGPRIAYTYENLGAVQTRTASLKSPADLSGTTFMVFAAPRAQRLPGAENAQFTGGLATVNPAGGVAFQGEPPFQGAAGGTVPLSEIQSAVR